MGKQNQQKSAKRSSKRTIMAYHTIQGPNTKDKYAVHYRITESDRNLHYFVFSVSVTLPSRMTMIINKFHWDIKANYHCTRMIECAFVLPEYLKTLSNIIWCWHKLWIEDELSSLPKRELDVKKLLIRIDTGYHASSIILWIKLQTGPFES